MNHTFRIIPAPPRVYEGSFRYVFNNPQDTDWIRLHATFKADYKTKLLQVQFLEQDKPTGGGSWAKVSATLFGVQAVDHEVSRVAEETENFGGDIQRAMHLLGYTFLEGPTDYSKHDPQANGETSDEK